MNKITFPLRLQMRGAAVADLQDGLLLLLDKGRFQMSAKDRRIFEDRLRFERAEGLYSEVTRKLVAVFQEQHRIWNTGEVDEATAKTINAMLEESGALAEAPVDQHRMVGGQVRRENGKTLRGATARAFHVTEGSALRLGEDSTDAEGRYTILYPSPPGAAAIRLQVAVFNADGKRLCESDIISHPKSLEIVDLIATVEEGATFQVEGKVSSRVSAGVSGLRVQIVDKTVGADVQLAEAVTAESGEYNAAFTGASLRERGKESPDLQARVFAGETLLAASEVRYNASNRETLNIMLDEKAAAELQSEHETLTSALSAHFTGRLADLKETDDRQDVTYLANKTGWDARAVALAALADQFSQRSGQPGQRSARSEVPSVFYYALFRAGLPANEDVLYRTETRTLEAVWKNAAENGVIPKDLTQAIPQTVERFRALGAQKLLTGPALAGVSSLKEMLTASDLDDARQKTFAELYEANRTDIPKFWDAVTDAFGKSTADRLQLDGKLGFLTLNNAPLAQALRRTAGGDGLSDPLQLAQLGFHRASRWDEVLTPNMPVPKEIPGDSAATKLANYKEYLAAQIRLSYPTASVAQMVKSGDLPLLGAAQGVSDQVHAFLTEQQGKFEIGMQPVGQFIARNNLQVAGATVEQVTRLQRVYQITPSDEAMTALMKRGIDSAYQVVRNDKETFVHTYQTDLGGPETAALIYDKSLQVHNAVLNLAVSYLTAKNGVGLGSQPMKTTQQSLNGSGQIIQPEPKGPTADNAADVIAYPTLEGLFGEMDFCACDHCRSVLSPAAYLVDLLLFIDQAPQEIGKENPQAVLFDRRPDIQHLPLTCENTNTALPYIDVVNETLEYFIANSAQELSLKDYVGHDTDGAASADLLASPQFVMDSAYAILRDDTSFPAPLPFHLPLENLRLYFEKFEASLPLVMERLRKGDDVERGANAYGWRDILMEEIGLSRAESEILTDSNAVPIRRMYGFPDGATAAEVIAALSNAKQFTRRVEITYEEIVSILMTRFVNPNSDLIPKLERLGVPFATLKAFKDGTITDDDFDALLPTGSGAPDPAAYGGDIKAWVKDEANYARIMALITLTDPTGNPDPCNFDQLEFRYAEPMDNEADTSTRLGAVEFARLLRFIRLWKKTGWTIEQTDAAICALYREDMQPLGPDDVDTLAKLDAGFLKLLPRIGIVVRVMSALNLTPKRDLSSLLACWSAIGAHGDGSLYRQMFLNPAVLKQDAVFADNGFGEYLTDNTKKLADHAEALRSAFNLTGDEYGRIVAALGYDANTPLTIPNISAVFRRGYLARKLRLSVRELLLLTSLTGLDPFAAPDPPNPAILRLVALVQDMKARSFKSAAALYLIWNQDLSGKSAPAPAQIIDFARTLRGDFAAIEDQFAATEDPNGDVARARMTLVYGQEAADAFFALLDDTSTIDVAYTHSSPALEAAITAADPRISYDDFKHRLSHTGLLTAATQTALKNVVGVSEDFKDAVDAIFARSEDAKGSFFARYPELKPLYDTYIASADPPATKRSALLAAFRPELSRRRKRQQALQRLSSAAALDLVSTQTLLDPTSNQYPLHAAGQPGQPVLNDVLALETPGLAAQFFFQDTATGPVGLSVPAAANLDYAGGGNSLPVNPTPGAAISGVWNGQIETPEAGFYNFVIEAEAGTTVTLTLGGQVRALTQNGNIFRNTAPLELKAGTLYEIELKVEKVKDRLSVKWETPKRAREVIPSRYLYPPTILAPFTDAYVRFLKAASLAAGLGLSVNEITYFATSPDYLISGDGWLNALPAVGDPTALTAVALLKPLRDLLDYARVKAELSPDDESLLTVLQDPGAATAGADGLLFTLTRWDEVSLDDLLAHFGGNVAGLAHFSQFRRVYDAFALIQKMGISASALIEATTNEPTGDTTRDFQAALRARYSADDWRDVVRPINDAMRGTQRDALVAYILHQMRSNPATEHIDTADKLFEYFLMDVQMEPCMQTSRIRHALSSVQLFIERCLMNLEPRVSPASIKAKQWEWMKRYRVWEANRKVFLYPENWLEPELRDDQSPFFKETMSELLQSDITEEKAAVALLNYLSKLEEVAKLEPCGIHYVENDPGAADDIAHVVARGAGANRKYFYRRREFGYWTPWEQIKLDIGDDPVIPVVWNGRLFLFWLRILKQSPLDTGAMPISSTASGAVSGLSLSDIKSDAKSSAQNNVKLTVQAILNWSEYYNGKWQPARTSDVDRPLGLGQFDSFGANAFDRSKLKLSVMFWTKGSIRIIVSNAIGVGGSSFFLHNAFSAPELREVKKDRHFTPKRTLETSTDSLKVTYDNASHSVLNNGISDRTVEPTHPIAGNPWDASFFYGDSRHVFYVTTAERMVTVPQWNDFGIVLTPPKMTADIPPLVLQPVEIIPDLIGPVSKQPGFGVVDPSPIERFVTEDAYIHQGIGTSGTVRFGDKEIGPSGSVMKSIRTR
jgi:Neuraminidase-like domain/Salmonella virulence plasmid 28.1kDa A protein